LWGKRKGVGVTGRGYHHQSGEAAGVKPQTNKKKLGKESITEKRGGGEGLRGGGLYTATQEKPGEGKSRGILPTKEGRGRKKEGVWSGRETKNDAVEKQAHDRKHAQKEKEIRGKALFCTSVGERENAPQPKWGKEGKKGGGSRTILKRGVCQHRRILNEKNGRGVREKGSPAVRGNPGPKGKREEGDMDRH